MNDVNTLRAYKDMFNSPQGRIVLEDMKDAHFFQTTTMTSPSVEILAFNEGQRNVILRILRILEISEETYVRARDTRPRGPGFAGANTSERFSTAEQRNAAVDAILAATRRVGEIEPPISGLFTGDNAEPRPDASVDTFLNDLFEPNGDEVVRQSAGPDKDGPECN